MAVGAVVAGVRSWLCVLPTPLTGTLPTAATDLFDRFSDNRTTPNSKRLFSSNRLRIQQYADLCCRRQHSAILGDGGVVAGVAGQRLRKRLPRSPIPGGQQQAEARVEQPCQDGQRHDAGHRDPGPCGRCCCRCSASARGRRRHESVARRPPGSDAAKATCDRHHHRRRCHRSRPEPAFSS